MDMYCFLCWVVFSLFCPVFSDEDFFQTRACCTFTGPGFEDIEYIISILFNKHEVQQYNSTRGNWTGFTPTAVENLKIWNGDPYDALTRLFEKKVLCADNIPLVQHIGELTAKPTIQLNLVKHPATLVCSAYNFYPRQIRMTWLRNGQELTSAVTSSEVLPDGEWYYQMHSHLEYIRTAGETITCMVEHLSLSEPMLQVWDPSLPASERVKIAVGLCGLMLGLVVVSAGFIYYKRKSAVYFTIYQGHVSIPVEVLPAVDAT